MHQQYVGGAVQTLTLGQQADLRQQQFHVLVPILRQQNLPRFLIYRVVPFSVFLLLLRQFWDDLIDFDVDFAAVVGWPGNNERSTRFVD